MKQRVKRLYRVRAEYSAGYYVTRDYQSLKAAEERAARLLEGHEGVPDPFGGEYIARRDPAVRVTIAESEIVTFGEPVEWTPPQGD